MCLINTEFCLRFYDYAIFLSSPFGCRPEGRTRIGGIKEQSDSAQGDRFS